MGREDDISSRTEKKTPPTESKISKRTRDRSGQRGLILRSRDHAFGKIDFYVGNFLDAWNTRIKRKKWPVRDSTALR